ncbi:hypothetical protein [Alistipes putredinis]|uniref:hypothetical protein n=5 Tax=Alistipes putredinis TaxID=28117 RepID=UPI003990AE2B
MLNKVMLSTESRMRGDMQVRFGGRYGKTYCRKAVRRSVPSLRNVATDQTYQLKISGPGIRTRSKEIEIKYVPGRIGNIDYYIPVERSADTVAFRPVETYRPKQIAPDARTIEDLYSHIPGITYEDGYLTDENGATVCLMFSGIIPDEAGYAAILTNLTADNIERIEYYRLDNLEEPYYDGVLNFVTVGVNFNAPSIKEQLTPSPGCEL